VGSVAGDESRTHGERLLNDIHDLLSAHGWKLADIDVFGVAAGPGSFTGLRIGIATVQGLAMVHRRPVVPVSALDALARSVVDATTGRAEEPEAESVSAWMDAHRSEIFWAHYAIDSPSQDIGRLTVVEGPYVEPPWVTLERWAHDAGVRRIRFVGDGAVRYAAEIESALGIRADVMRVVPSIAPTIAAMAIECAASGCAVAPAAVRPLYVRRPDAELAREARGRTSRP
jgi:tRNA threonylcarbamoyladenosine biosynthesis protein TsaB